MAQKSQLIVTEILKICSSGIPNKEDIKFNPFSEGLRRLFWTHFSRQVFHNKPKFGNQESTIPHSLKQYPEIPHYQG